MRAPPVAAVLVLGALPCLVTGDTFVQRYLRLTDPSPELGAYQRTYMLGLPANYNATRTAGTKFPLLLYFHGQGGAFKTDAAEFAKLGAKSGFITVAPKGMADGGPGASVAWSVAAEGRTDVCTRQCEPVVFKSCRAMQPPRVSNCNWATCYDDAHFVSQLLAALRRELRVDVTRVYSTGVSNGAMLAYWLQSQLPRGTFAAVLPWYGAYLTPMLPRVDASASSGRIRSLRGTSLLALHGAKDKEIPPRGGESSDHYLYASEAQAVGAWASANGCDAAAAPLPTPFDARPLAHACFEHRHCDSGARVAYCTYPNQAHGFWPKYGEKLVWWFAQNQTTASARG